METKISWECFQYTWKHKLAFLKVEKAVLGRYSWRGVVHDLDKLLWWFPVGFLLGKSWEWVHVQHTTRARHHTESNTKKSYDDYVEMIIDWECARYTKPDKPLDAYDTLYKFYPELVDEVLPILKKLHLSHEQ